MKIHSVYRLSKLHGSGCILLALLSVAGFGVSSATEAAGCLYVSSYHAGYEWNDGIERGIERVLSGKCELDRFYMDTHRDRSDGHAARAALAAREHIEQTRPDVVIACDDAASKYLVMPYYRDVALPFVFCGINGTVEPYGYPYANTTGMIEISPIKPLMREVMLALGVRARRGVYLGPEIISQHKEFELNRKIYAAEGIVIEPLLVKDMDEWERGFARAQGADFVIMGNNGGIPDWDAQRAYQAVLEHSRTLTVTNYDWMVHFAMLSMTKLPEEQGEWAAETALRILAGEPVANIPIVPNRRMNIFLNEELLAKSGLALGANIMGRAIRVGAPPG